MLLECFEYNQHFVAMMNIINYARLTNKEGKFEKHHIIPRCFYKTKGLEIDNSEYNLVKLTPEQHRKVHKLAALCAKDFIKPKLKRANYIMNSIRPVGMNNPMYGISSYYKCKNEEKLQRIEKLKLHSKGHKNPQSMKDKLSKIRTESNKKRHWYNNGIKNVFTEVCPVGFVAGKLCSYKEIGRKWYNDGKKEIYSHDCPEGYNKGRLVK